MSLFFQVGLGGMMGRLEIDGRLEKGILPLWLLVLCCLTLLCWPLGAAAQSTTKSDPSANPWKPRVLVLHSYHHGFTWSDNISQGIRSVFEGQPEDVELRFEFMDTRRVFTEEYFGELKRLFRVKYAGAPIDVIIASDDHAYNFMMGAGKEVFPNVPIVFCSVSGYEPSVQEDQQLVGLIESIDIKATLDLALRLHPGTREVAVITDMTRTGRALRAKADKVFAGYESALNFTYLEDLTIEALGQEVSALSEKTIVFLFIFSRDKAGRVFSHEHNLRILLKHCNLPIYAVWEFYLGHGIVGGMLTSGEREGRMAAELALRILDGENAANIPLQKSPTEYMFDYRQLERFGIKEGLLPEDRIVINKPFSFYEEYRHLIWSVVSVLVLLILGVAVLAGHIMFRKRAELALKESEQKYRTLYDNAADVIILVDSDGNLLDVNRTFEQESGYARNEMVGSNIFTSGMLTKASTARALSAFKELLNGKAWQHVEIDGVTKDGRTIPYEVRAVPVKKDGEVHRFQAVLRNIRERREAQEVLRTEKEKFEILVEESPLAVSLIGKGGEYRYTNPKFQEMFGYTLEDIPTGRAWFSKAFPDPKYREEVISAWSADIKESKTSEARPRIFDVTCKDGSEKVIHFRPVTMRNGDQLVICEDITEQRRLERRLRQAQKMEAIGTLAGGIAHDFNNMLTPIMMQTEMAMQLLPKESPIQHNLEEVAKAGHRAKDLVKQILTFGRQSDRQRLPLKITPVVKETMKLLRSSLPATVEIKQAVNVKSDVVITDPTEVHQVLMNLCTNAAHAMRKKGGVLEIELSDTEIGPEHSGKYPGLKPGSYLRLTVSDSGEGMDPAIMDRIFDPFFTTKSREEGTGMGLAVVHGIVRSYGGAISVESEPEKGATFHILLPKAEKAAGASRKPIGPAPAGNERILLVDDEESVLTTVGMMLEHLGYDVVAEKSSTRALETFQAEPDRFDLVITDQTMPGMSGTALAQSIFSARADLPIILFTGYGNGVTKEESEALGISDYVMKPLVMDDMARTIRRVLDRAVRHKKMV